jgi:copper transport protein
MDGQVFFSFLMVTLVQIGVVFWVGAQLWHAFVLQLSEADPAEQKAIDQQSYRRFLRIFSIPTLFLILLANLGVLLGRALTLANGRLDQAFSQFGAVIGQGNSGTYWLAREILGLLALVLAGFLLRSRARSQIFDELVAWANLLFALGLLIAMALSGEAATVANNVLVYAVLLDWLHLLAAALWVGGMFYLSLIYLPILRELAIGERVRALLFTLPHYSLLALAGIIILAITGPFNAATHMQSLDQLFSTTYGRTLLVKSFFVVALLLTSVYHIFFLRPKLSRTHQRYLALIPKEEPATLSPSLEEQAPAAQTGGESKNQTGDVTLDEINEHRLNVFVTKQMEAQRAKQLRHLSSVLRWEPLLGVAVLLCTGLLSVFAGTLQVPIPQQPSSSTTVKPFESTAKTADNKFTLAVQVSPYRFGNNTFTVRVQDSQGTPATNATVTAYITMLDMDMGTEAVKLQPDGKGQFTGESIFSMGGHWQLRIAVRTSDNTVHEAKIALAVPF